MAATKTLMVRSWRWRYATAPSWIAAATSRIGAVPASARSTWERRTDPYPRPTSAHRRTAMRSPRSTGEKGGNVTDDSGISLPLQP